MANMDMTDVKKAIEGQDMVRKRICWASMPRSVQPKTEEDQQREWARWRNEVRLPAKSLPGLTGDRGSEGAEQEKVQQRRMQRA